jgi:formylglycine-generating enzyme required for sulfatase activity
MPQVFISYSRKDLKFVEQLAADLQNAGLDVWYDLTDIGGGARWRIEIENALAKCQYLVVVLSPDSVASEWVEKEYLFASEYRPVVIPLLYRSCKIPLHFTNLNFIDVQGDNYKNNFPKLLDALRVPPPPVVHVDEQTLKSSIKFKPLYLVMVTVVLAAILFAGILASKGNKKVDLPVPTSTTIVSEPVIDSMPLSTPEAKPTDLPTITPLPENLVDHAGVSMVLIPSGEFLMGSSNGSLNEKPEQTVNLDEYYIDRFEVTNEFYAACMNAKVCAPPNHAYSFTHEVYFGEPEFADYPVIYVNWYMAKAYCEWRGARLPTEAEWEKAARGTDGKTYPWGDWIDCTMANYDTGVDYCRGDTTPVGIYEVGKSIYGLYDMAGNVQEWVSSLNLPYPYNERDGRESLTSNGDRIMRGGAWVIYDPVALKSFTRVSQPPDSSFNNVGFRCAEDAAP